MLWCAFVCSFQYFDDCGRKSVISSTAWHRIVFDESLVSIYFPFFYSITSHSKIFAAEEVHLWLRTIAFYGHSTTVRTHCLL